jgi:ATP-dependent helicase/nuclease subunit B
MPSSEIAAVTERRARVVSISFSQDLTDAALDLISARSAGDGGALAYSLLLLPNNRAIRSMTEAFVRRAAPGLLLPRMVAIGDLALDEAIGPLFDPLEAEEPVWPVIASAERLAILARLVRANQPVSVAEALRLARKLAETIDELEVEQIPLARLRELTPTDDLANHWQLSFKLISTILPVYKAMRDERRLLDPAERRNILLGRFEQRLRDRPPEHPVIAVGITTAAPAVARVLRRLTRIEHGLVVLPGVDLAMPDDQWDSLLSEDASEEVHPQFHLRLLLDRMSVSRNEVDEREAERDTGAIAEVFALPERSTDWRGLAAWAKKIPQVQLVEAHDVAEEARVVAVAVRAALETPGKRIAVVTPDRELAGRIAAQLRRWGVDVDDSAGTPLLQTPEGALLLSLAQAIANRFRATDMLEIAKHPLVTLGYERIEWLAQARAADRHLRGPAEGSGLDALAAVLRRKAPEDEALHSWWSALAVAFAPLTQAADADLPMLLEALQAVLSDLTDQRIWRGAGGRELARLFDEYGSSNLGGLTPSDLTALPAIIRELLGCAVVRPPYGKHPRVALLGLLEARMHQADLVICSGLNEGSWPQLPQPDPWLAPAIRRHLGLANLDRNIGLSAHDLATALGAKEVLLTRAERDRSGPTVASRFLLRMKALFADELRRDRKLPAYAALLDRLKQREKLSPRPEPRPTAEQRAVRLSITDFDQLKSDPYSFYAKRILRYAVLDPVDAQPSHAWRGTRVHEILQRWFEEDDCAPERLLERAAALRAEAMLEPSLRVFWLPRIVEGLRWVAIETARLRSEEGRQLLVAEQRGEIELLGIKVTGRADRIDATQDGDIVVIDYKTGGAPGPKQVNAGFALQLGLVGLMAERGAIEGVKGSASRFEYWSLAKNQKDKSFGVLSQMPPATGKYASAAEDFVTFATGHAEEALRTWILGSEPFTAKLHPEYGDYGDYDQLMRRQEWDGRQMLVEGGA